MSVSSLRPSVSDAGNLRRQASAVRVHWCSEACLSFRALQHLGVLQAYLSMNIVRYSRSLSLFGSLLALSVTAQAEPVTLNVPILLHGSIGQDACPQRGRAIGGGEDASVIVQSGPNTGFREVGQLHEGDIVLICERLGSWLGIVYGSEPLGCQTTVLLPTQTEYTGPCERGWVQADRITDDPSSRNSAKQPDEHESAG